MISESLFGEHGSIRSARTQGLLSQGLVEYHVSYHQALSEIIGPRKSCGRGLLLDLHAFFGPIEDDDASNTGWTSWRGLPDPIQLVDKDLYSPHLLRRPQAWHIKITEHRLGARPPRRTDSRMRSAEGSTGSATPRSSVISGICAAFLCRTRDNGSEYDLKLYHAR